MVVNMFMILNLLCEINYFLYEDFKKGELGAKVRKIYEGKFAVND